MNKNFDFNTAQDKKIVYTLVTLAFLIILIRNAWVSDDAYITFRSIENFLSGYGPNYNVVERVQTFTHPLWFFLLSGVYFLVNRLFNIFFWAELYYLAIFISLIISLAAILLLMNRLAASPLNAILGGVTLLLSKAFIDYSTSGLENPLTHLILLYFLWIFFRDENVTPATLFKLSLLAALGALSRLDTALLFAPALLYAFWHLKAEWKKALIAALKGFIPLILWEIFSLFYYGFPFPNTAYAKLNTGITLGRSLRQGFYYYLNALGWDPLTLLVIFFGILLVILLKKKRQFPIVIGIVLYLLYILKVGGDFMSGRFFTAPFLAALVLLTMHKFADLKSYGFVFAAILLLGLNAPRPPILSHAHIAEAYGEIVKIDEKGIADERLQYYPEMGFLLDRRATLIPGSQFAGKAWVLSDAPPLPVDLTGALGVVGYTRGPDLHVIDTNALADPLLARLPARDPVTFRIGHFVRKRPDGYIETLESGENQIADQNLAAYYEKLSFIIRGELFNRERLVEIWKMNTGKYDYLLEAYLDKQK